MNQNLQFDITVDVSNCRYHMRVERIHAGDSLERFRVSAGGRAVILQSNRPALLHSGLQRPVVWKLLEGQYKTTNVQEATFALFKVMTSIEDYVKQLEPTLKEYMKQHRLFS